MFLTSKRVDPKFVQLKITHTHTHTHTHTYIYIYIYEVSQKTMPSYRNNYQHRNMYYASKWSWSSVDHIPTSQHSHYFSPKQCSTFEWVHVSLPRRILLTFLWANSSLQFSLPRYWHNVYLFDLMKEGSHIMLKEQSAELYEAWIQALIWRWNMAIEKGGDYVEK